MEFPTRNSIVTLSRKYIGLFLKEKNHNFT